MSAEDQPIRSRLGLPPRADYVVVVAALGVLSAVSPLATDMYLASLPDLAEYFGTTAAAVQLTLTTYMVGIAAGQFLLGPLSDVWGRHKLMVAGNAVFLLASLGIVVAPTIEAVLVLRTLQGLAGAAGVVIARAVVSDISHGTRAAQLYSILGLIVSLGPVVAPLLGGVIATVAHWQVVFWVLTGFGAFMLACSVLVIPETLPPHRRAQGGLGRIFSNALAVVRDRRFILYALGFAFSFGALFSYISASSFVIQNVLGYSALGYSVVFAINAGGSILVATANTQLVKRYRPQDLLLVGVAGLAVFSVINLVLVLWGAVGTVTLVLLFLSQACMGLILGNAVAMAQHRAQRLGLSGTGSAVVGMLQFVLAGLVSPLTGLGGENTAVPMVVCTGVSAVIAVIMVVAARR